MRTIPVSLSACLRWEKTEFSLSSDFPSFLPGQTGDTLGSLEILLTQGKGFAVFGNFQGLNLVPPSGDGKRQQVKARHIIGPGKLIVTDPSAEQSAFFSNAHIFNSVWLSRVCVEVPQSAGP